MSNAIPRTGFEYADQGDLSALYVVAKAALSEYGLVLSPSYLAAMSDDSGTETVSSAEKIAEASEPMDPILYFTVEAMRKVVPQTVVDLGIHEVFGLTSTPFESAAAVVGAGMAGVTDNLLITMNRKPQSQADGDIEIIVLTYNEDGDGDDPVHSTVRVNRSFDDFARPEPEARPEPARRRIVRQSNSEKALREARMADLRVRDTLGLHSVYKYEVAAMHEIFRRTAGILAVSGNTRR